MKKLLLSACLAVSILCSTITGAYAAEQPDLGIAPCTAYIKQAYATLDISDSSAAIYRNE